MNTRLFMLTGMAICCGGRAFAGDPADMPEPPTFSEIDANGDLLITEEEFESFMERRTAERGRGPGPRGRFNPIEQADVDGDGALNEQEYEEMMESMRHMRERGGPRG